MVKKRIVLLGATGSIGISTLEVIAEHKDRFELILATAHSQAEKMIVLAVQYQIPNLLFTDNTIKDKQLSIPKDINVHYGEDTLLHLLKTLDYDIALNAISGSAGLKATIAVLETGKTLALANKESLVMAGYLVKELQAKHGSKIIPVDSEHSALFQAIGCHQPKEIAKVHLTASGGAFRTLPLQEFTNITVEQALKHPNWNMGAKVTLDSATMFNKALEVIEAHWLFDLMWEQIEVVIHPQSIVHSLVEFIDGSFMAQLSKPDMKLPILYAFSYPERIPSSLVKTDLLSLPALTFEPISKERYPLFFIGVEAGIQGGLIPTVTNAANEAALQLFIDGKIKFVEIAKIVEDTLKHVKNEANPSLPTILEINAEIFQRIIKEYY